MSNFSFQSEDGSVIYNCSPYRGPEVTIEEKKKQEEQKEQDRLSRLEDANDRFIKDDGTFEDEKIYKQMLKKDIRLVREIFESHSPEMSKILHFPQIGESTSSLRYKRELHLAAAAMVLRGYPNKQLKEAEKKIGNKLDERPVSVGSVNKPVLIGGLFLICAVIAASSLIEDDNPPLTWTLLLAGMWSAGVWLWGQWCPKKRKIRAPEFIKKAAVNICFFSALPAIACTVFYLYTSTLPHNRGKDLSSAVLSLAALIVVIQGIGLLYWNGLDEK
jgi:hypothetical protein